LSRLVFSIHKVKYLLSIPKELKIILRCLSTDLDIFSTIDSAFMNVSFLVAHALYCRGIIIATSHAKHKVRVHPPTALLRMRGGPHICYSSVCIPLFQRSSRHTTEIQTVHVQYSTACLTVWLCRICLRHSISFPAALAAY